MKFLNSPFNIKIVDFTVIDGPFWVAFPAFLVIIAIAAYSFYWVYQDAVKRDKSGTLVLVLIALVGYPLSFLWWLWLRPPVKVNSTPNKTGEPL